MVIPRVNFTCSTVNLTTDTPWSKTLVFKPGSTIYGNCLAPEVQDLCYPLLSFQNVRSDDSHWFTLVFQLPKLAKFDQPQLLPLLQ